MYRSEVKLSDANKLTYILVLPLTLSIIVLSCNHYLRLLSDDKVIYNLYCTPPCVIPAVYFDDSCFITIIPPFDFFMLF